MDVGHIGCLFTPEVAGTLAAVRGAGPTDQRSLSSCLSVDETPAPLTYQQRLPARATRPSASS